MLKQQTHIEPSCPDTITTPFSHRSKCEQMLRALRLLDFLLLQMNKHYLLIAAFLIWNIRQLHEVGITVAAQKVEAQKRWKGLVVTELSSAPSPVTKPIIVSSVADHLGACSLPGHFGADTWSCDSWLILQSVTVGYPIQFSLRTSARRSCRVVESEKGEMIQKKGILISSSKSVIKNPQFA